ncbi:MAG: substrate-binding domain-containing protein [Chloroflexi bacterium]|nr:substrate-binding domain-containing protein [Chloroflexota bacterium]
MTTINNRTRVIGLAALSVMMLTASSGSAIAASPPASGAPASAAAVTGKVGIVAFDSTSPIDKIFAESTKAQLESVGNTTLMQDPKGDPGQANTICSQYVTASVDAIVVTVFAMDQMAQCVASAADAQIPLFFLGGPLLDGMQGAISFTSPAPINDAFIKYVTDNGITDVLALDYSPGTPCRVRAEYRTKVLAEQAPSVNVTKHEFPIPGQVVDAQNTTAAWLAAHPVDQGKYAIWSCFADPTSGAGAALNQVGRTDVPIFTWDFNQTILPAIQSGQIAADLYLDAVQVGVTAAGLVQDYLNGNTVPQGVEAPTQVLNKDNIDQFLLDHPEALGNG